MPTMTGNHLPGKWLLEVEAAAGQYGWVLRYGVYELYGPDIGCNFCPDTARELGEVAARELGIEIAAIEMP